MKKEHCNTVWKENINFFLDGVSFAYKRKVAHQKEEFGESCAKDSTMDTLQKERSGGKLAKLMAAISYGKGVIDCKQYDKMSGFFFKDYITCEFPVLFKKADRLHSKLWIQYGCPCQNSKAAKNSNE